MQSVSASNYLRVVRRTRAALPGGVLWTSLLVFLLTLAVSKSTVTAQWVIGIEVIPLVALSGAIVMGVLALAPIPWGTGIAIGLAVGPLAAGYASWPVLHGLHPTDTIGLGLLGAWWGRVVDGSAIADSAFDLYLISWLMWVTGGWLAWCVLRWRRPLLGFVPGAAAFATNLLNFPINQNGYVLAVLVLTLALLLWSNYVGSIANATRARVKLTGDARWDFWESGLVAMAALIVLAIMLPPLSTIDRTADMESSAFSGWAQLLSTLNHPGQVGSGSGGGGTTGFSAEVGLHGSLKRTRDIVFTYTRTGVYEAAPYFRGVNEVQVANEEWRYPIGASGARDRLAKNTLPPYVESYEKLAVAAFNVKMISPPIGYSDILFYPGELDRVSRDTIAIQVLQSSPNDFGSLTTIDRLSSLVPAVSTGSYTATVDYSTATTADLKAAGTTYPGWVSLYIGLPSEGYRSPDVLARIKGLAEQIVAAAGARTPYDEAVAIEAYLRSDIFTYTLDLQNPPGVDPLDYFLFTSHRGYCEYFATAMGDMLRLLGVPTRLVNGFGPGQYDAAHSGYVVRSEDAHTWVESYFPGYGWIPFEPTHDPQNIYQVIPRGAQGSNLCLRDNQCDNPVGAIGPGGVLPTPTGPGRGLRDPSQQTGGTGGFALRVPDAGTMTRIMGILLALFLLLFAGVARYLRPRTVMGVWRRTRLLARMAGADERLGETPLELGRRLARTFPETSDPVRSLANGFVVAAYAPPDVAGTARASVMEAWSALRPLLLRRFFSRLRPARV